MPWIFEARDLWPEAAASVGWLSEDGRAYKWLLKRARSFASSADAVIVPTPGLVEKVIEHGAAQVELIPQLVTDNPPSALVRENARRELEIPSRACVFLYLGAHGVANGLDSILDAAKNLDRPDDVVFVFAGDGSDRRRLVERAKIEEIPGVRILGAVGRERVADLLAASDVGLHTMRDDPLFRANLPVKALEYFGSRRPFVTTVPGLPQQLAIESGGGFADTLDGLVRELGAWIDMSREKRADRGEQSFRYGYERFGLPAAADQLEELLNRAIAARKF